VVAWSLVGERSAGAARGGGKARQPTKQKQASRERGSSGLQSSTLPLHTITAAAAATRGHRGVGEQSKERVGAGVEGGETRPRDPQDLAAR